MIALAGLATLRRADAAALGRRLGFAVHPRWALADAAGAAHEEPAAAP